MEGMDFFDFLSGMSVIGLVILVQVPRWPVIRGKHSWRGIYLAALVTSMFWLFNSRRTGFVGAAVLLFLHYVLVPEVPLTGAEGVSCE